MLTSRQADARGSTARGARIGLLCIAGDKLGHAGLNRNTARGKTSHEPRTRETLDLLVSALGFEPRTY